MALARHLRREDVIDTATLRQLGFSYHAVGTLVAHGDLVRRHRGVYLDGRTRPTPWILLKAALLAAGPTAFLSHRSAAATRRYRSINPYEIHVSVIAQGTPRIPDLIIHRTTEPARGEVTVVSGLRVASLPRILVDLAATKARDAELEELITQGERRSVLDDITATLDRHARHPGIGRLRHLLAHHVPLPAANSNLERDFWAWYVTEPDLPPPDETNVHLGPHEWDAIWHQRRLVLEIDSRDYHLAKTDFERDRIKDIYAQKRALRIVRVTADRFRLDRSGVRADLLAFLGPSGGPPRTLSPAR